MRAVVRRKQHVLRKKPRPPEHVTTPSASAHNALHAYRRAFVEWSEVVGLSIHTATQRSRAVSVFIDWCDERALNRQATRHDQIALSENDSRPALTAARNLSASEPSTMRWSNDSEK